MLLLHHLSKELLGPKLSCAYLQEPTGYIPRASLSLSYFLILWALGNPCRYVRRPEQQLHQKASQSRFSFSPDSFLPFITDADFAFYLAEVTETRYTTCQPLITVTKKLLEEKSTAPPAVTPPSGKPTGSRSTILRQTRLQGPS